jgi:hypothetical protein
MITFESYTKSLTTESFILLKYWLFKFGRLNPNRRIILGLFGVYCSFTTVHFGGKKHLRTIFFPLSTIKSVQNPHPYSFPLCSRTLVPFLSWPDYGGMYIEVIWSTNNQFCRGSRNQICYLHFYNYQSYLRSTTSIIFLKKILINGSQSKIYTHI